MEKSHQASEDFFIWLDEWQTGLPVISMKDAAPFPQKTAITSVDVVNGFCNSGALASPRVKGIIDPVVRIFQAAWDHGVRNFVLNPDTHEPDAVEFSAFPPHCIRGTEEADDVPEIKALPFYEQMVRLPKNSISSEIQTGLSEWFFDHSEVSTVIVVGDCTDLCIYQLAMQLRLDANARQLQRRIIVPVSAVDTYDYPVAAARQQGGLPHPGDLLHGIFLYHMALNAIEIVKDIV